MLLSRFRKDQRGSLLPTFAIGTTAIFGFVGAAVDYSRGAALKASLQTALDSTALILSQEADKLAPGDLSAKATAYFNAQFSQSGAKNVIVTSNLSNPQQGSFILHVAA